jgi:hypothetical protein
VAAFDNDVIVVGPASSIIDDSDVAQIESGDDVDDETSGYVSPTNESRSPE